MGEGTFLKKDDPKIIVLMQQELLSSLAFEVHIKTDQSFEDAWKATRFVPGITSSFEYSTGSTILCQINERLDGLCEVEHQPPEKPLTYQACRG
ncbi:hypothetical protein OSB04_012821 [Centaurea solstitialis]|uniref:Uncharacterized protein n=1 Tax=Centaurea solstitialis TaxID=347529 RepID=A0AA38TV53_9ASTR|nr:hypothetical protein OSB04_012821 [Centaurea solstitialis]